MLHTQALAPELLAVLRQLMSMESLRDFRIVGGTALALQLGHRESEDIDLFSSGDFPSEEIYQELIKKFIPDNNEVLFSKDVMIQLKVNGVKIDIVNENYKYIRDAVVEDGMRMASLEDIAAMKLKTTCDPFSGRKTRKDLVDIATLLDKFTVREMSGFFLEKYSTMYPLIENVITLLNRDWEIAERNSIMPKMFNGYTWETTQQKVLKGLKDYFDELLQEREIKLRRNKK